MLDEFGIKDKTDMFTTDNEATMDKCFPKNIRNCCFSHIDSKASQKALDSSSRLKLIRKKLRKIAKKANKSSKFKGLVRNAQKSRNIRVLTIKQEIVTRFTCTYEIFRSVLNDPNEGKDEEVDREKINLNIDAINESMKKLFSKKEYESLEIRGRQSFISVRQSRGNNF